MTRTRKQEIFAQTKMFGDAIAKEGQFLIDKNLSVVDHAKAHAAVVSAEARVDELVEE